MLPCTKRMRNDDKSQVRVRIPGVLGEAGFTAVGARFRWSVAAFAETPPHEGEGRSRTQETPWFDG
jgi:hypothetical protein